MKEAIRSMSREQRLAELIKVEKPSRWDTVSNTPNARMFLTDFGDRMKGMFLWPGELSELASMSFTREEFFGALNKEAPCKSPD